MIELSNILRDLSTQPLWSDLCPVDPEAASFSVQRGNGKDILYVFCPAKSRPTLVIKVPPSTADHDRIIREFNRLNLFQQNLQSSLPGMPHLFALFHTSCGPALVMPYYEADSMAHHLLAPFTRRRADRWTALLERAAAWLLAFQQGTRCRVNDPAALLRSNHFVVSAAPDLHAGLESGALPGTGQHGDFNPANILLVGDMMLVLDWEWSEWPGLPVMDLFNLALRSYMLRDNAGKRGGRLPAFDDVHRFLSPQAPERYLLSKWLGRFHDGLQIARPWIKTLFETWLDHLPGDRSECERAKQIAIMDMF